MLRFLILAIVGYVFYRALKKWMIGVGGTDGGQRKSTGDAVDDVLIQDPVCQTYFAQRDGVHLLHEGRNLYFCSPKCRERYLHGHNSSDDQAGSA